MVIPLAVSAAAMPGAIWTTDSAGNTVNQNTYATKYDVYLNGGPKSDKAPGLPDGYYYVQVTSPNGVVLGSSVFGPNQTPVHVINGRFEYLYQLINIVYTSPGVTGYHDTPNPGGEYKVWISLYPDFPNSGSKTDNFKVLIPCGD